MPNTLLDAEDIITEARSIIQCAFMATDALEKDFGAPIAATLNVADDRLKAALELVRVARGK